MPFLQTKNADIWGNCHYNYVYISFRLFHCDTNTILNLVRYVLEKSKSFINVKLNKCSEISTIHRFFDTSNTWILRRRSMEFLIESSIRTCNNMAFKMWLLEIMSFSISAQTTKKKRWKSTTFQTHNQTDYLHHIKNIFVVANFILYSVLFAQFLHNHE